MTTATRLGVDLGTTWTAAAVRQDSRWVQALELGSAAPAMPSVVAVEGGAGENDGGPARKGRKGGKGGAVIAGEQAERQLLADPVSGLREIKRRLGDTTPMVMAGKPYGAEALMGHLLRHVVATATDAADGTAPGEVVLTHPAVWGDYKLDLLREAARQAGVAQVTLMAEPVAAALHYVSLGRLSAGDVVAVYDFGGGTFDAAVVQCTEHGAEIRGRPEGLERLGGVDLDQIVVLHVNQALDGRLRELDTTDPEGRRALARLRSECTAAKEALSLDTEVAIPVALPGLHTEVRITRDEFEAAARARIADTLGALDRAIAEAAVDLSSLAGVLLVGGSSRIPVVAEEVGRRTGRPTLLDADPKLVVALGAAGGSTVMSPTPNNDPIDAPERPSDASPPPPPPPRPGAPSAPLSPSAQAGARAAALRAAADTGKSPAKGKGKGATVAGAAGAAVAAAAAGYAAYEVLIDDEGGGNDEDESDAAAAELVDPDLAAADDDSLDAFDDVGGGGRGSGGGGSGGRGFGGGGGERVVVRERPPSRPGSSSPDAPPALADIGEARAELLQRFAAWVPPASADPAEVAAFRAEVEGIINRYQPRPGVSRNDALAELRQQFDDSVEDFVQDLKLDAVTDQPPMPAEPGPGFEEPHWEWDADQGRWEWDRGSESEPRWQWDQEQGRWDWVEDPDAVPDPPPVRDGYQWVPDHHDEHGALVGGHWERAPAVWGEMAGAVDRPGLDWVPAHVDQYGRRIPAHWEAEQPVPPPPPPTAPPTAPPVVTPEPAPVRRWVEGRYDEHGKYEKGHWEDAPAPPATPVPPTDGAPYDPDAPPPIIQNPPTAPPASPVPPTAPPASPVPPTAPPPPPADPSPYPDPYPRRPVVRDHRGDDDDSDDGGVRVISRGPRGTRGEPVVRDHRAGSQPANDPTVPTVPGVPPLRDVFEPPQTVPLVPGTNAQSAMARQVPPADAAEAAATATAALEATAAAEAARTTPAASATPPAPEPPTHEPPAPEPPADGAPGPADDLLGVRAFADATAKAPDLDIAAEIPSPSPAPEPAPAGPVAPAPEPAAAPEPTPEVAVIVDPIPAGVPPDAAELPELPPEPDPSVEDEAPADLDNNPHTPL